MNTPPDDEQALERLLHEFYNGAYDASSLPTPTNVWQGVMGRLSSAGLHVPADAQPHGQPSEALAGLPTAADDVAAGADAPDATPIGGPTPLPRALAPTAPQRRIRSARRLPRAVAPLIAAVLIVGLFVSLFVALGDRRGASGGSPAAPHPCLQAATTRQAGVVAVGLTGGGVTLLRASDGQPLWQYHGSDQSAYPLIWGQTVIVSAGANVLLGLRLSDGFVLWRATVGTLETNQPGAPFIVDCGVALVNEANGGLVAVRVSDGARLWNYQDYPTPTQLVARVYPYLDTPTLLTAGDGIAYVISQRLRASGQRQTITWSVKALRETDGRLLWQTQPTQPDPRYQQPNATPNTLLALATPPFSGATLGAALYLIPVAAQPTLTAYQATTGALVWQRQPAALDATPVFSVTDGQLILDSGGIAQLTAADGALYLTALNVTAMLFSVSLRDGALTPVWQGAGKRLARVVGAEAAPYLITNGVLYYVNDVGDIDPIIAVNALNLSRGSTFWTWYAPGTGDILVSPLVAIVFALAATSGVIVAGAGSFVQGLRASDGHPLWQWAPGGAHPAQSEYADAIAAG